MPDQSPQNIPVFCDAQYCPPIVGAQPGRRLVERPLLVCTACRIRTRDRVSELGLGTVHGADVDAESRTLPSLYTALLSPTRVANVGGGAGRDVDPAAPIPAGAIEARRAILELFRVWATNVSGSAGPSVGWDAALVLRRLTRLLMAEGGPAVAFVDNVDRVYLEARAQAYPTPPDGILIGTCPVGTPEGPCGGEVRALAASSDDDGWAVCRRCKTAAVVAWWLALMPTPDVEWMGMRALRWHLTLHAGRQISEHTIRSWARARSDGSAPELLSRTNDNTGRLEYQTAGAVELARLGRARGRGQTFRSA